MRILAVSDIHQEEESLERIRKNMEGADCLLVCGDISRNVSFAEDFISAFPDAYIVPGNWDSGPADEIISSAKNCAHEKRLELCQGLNIAGFGYSGITPFHTHGELTEEEIYSRMSRLAIDSGTILLLHCPPKGFFDDVRGKHIGSESILRIITEKKPFAAFFGHAHNHEGTSMLNGTTLIKVPPANEMRGAIAETDGKKIKAGFVDL